MSGRFPLLVVALAIGLGQLTAPSGAYAAQFEETKVAPHGLDPNDKFVRFGLSVDMSGDRAIVGSPYEDSGGVASVGAAYVYEHDGWSWAEVAKLAPPDPALATDFGLSVAISGDWALIGAPGAGAAGEGHFYSRVPFSQPGQWLPVQAVGPSVATWGFGHDVALDGNRAAVASFVCAGCLGTNYVAIFERVGGAWQETQVLAGPGLEGYGMDLALRGDYLAVGAPWTNGQEGGVYVYEHDGSSFQQVAQVAPPRPQAYAQFGAAVDIGSDGRLLVGVPQDDAHASRAGTAYSFSATNGWSYGAELGPRSRQASQYFGISASFSGAFAVVGAFGDGYANWQWPGAGYAFVDSLFGWVVREQLKASDSPPLQWLGYAAAISGDWALLGAPAGDTDNIGAAYFYSGVACGEDREPPEMIEAVEKDGILAVVVADDTSVSSLELSWNENALLEFVAPTPEWWQSSEPAERLAARSRGAGDRERAGEETELGTAHYDEHPEEVTVRFVRVEPRLPASVEIIVRDPCGGESRMKPWS